MSRAVLNRTSGVGVFYRAGYALGTWETFDHTADVGLRVTGADLDDLFRTAAEAVFDYIVVNRHEVRVAARDEIVLGDEDAGGLLVSWLNELIFLSETKHVVYSEFVVSVSPDGKTLKAEAGGEPVDRTRHDLDHEVKAVTRHALELGAADGGGWVAEFVLDI